ncbi:polysaccharide deacetylase family protein [Campylobacter mucosalis]|uniref:polysaccharide deacetylase family protein n=1 Tax=Campylobacter mucosalis TaxID=202 RepID=UPI00147007BF|nr:polysaccharide deacetylase family protein [Campylobacter mucosalis]
MGVVVLMYHHILPESGFIASSVSEFLAQMKFLADNGYKTLTSSEFLAYKKGEFAPPKKSVFITFDDGWRDNFYYAYPILKQFNLNATIFLVTQWIEKSSEQNALKKAEFTPLQHAQAKQQAPQNPASLFLNWDEVAKMSELCNFHSHTHGHTDGYFGNLSFKTDLKLCKSTIKNRLGFDDTHLCWPRGKFDDERLKIAKNLGYEIFYTTERGANLADKNLDYVKRIAVKNGAFWLKKSLCIYQNGFIGKIYTRLKG